MIDLNLLKGTGYLGHAPIYQTNAFWKIDHGTNIGPMPDRFPVFKPVGDGKHMFVDDQKVPLGPEACATQKRILDGFPRNKELLYSHRRNRLPATKSKISTHHAFLDLGLSIDHPSPEDNALALKYKDEVLIPLYDDLTSFGKIVAGRLINHRSEQFGLCLRDGRPANSIDRISQVWLDELDSHEKVAKVFQIFNGPNNGTWRDKSANARHRCMFEIEAHFVLGGASRYGDDGSTKGRNKCGQPTEYTGGYEGKFFTSGLNELSHQVQGGISNKNSKNRWITWSGQRPKRNKSPGEVLPPLSRRKTYEVYDVMTTTLFEKVPYCDVKDHPELFQSVHDAARILGYWQLLDLMPERKTWPDASAYLTFPQSCSADYSLHPSRQPNETLLLTSDTTVATGQYSSVVTPMVSPTVPMEKRLFEGVGAGTTTYPPSVSLPPRVHCPPREAHLMSQLEKQRQENQILQKKLEQAKRNLKVEEESKLTEIAAITTAATKLDHAGNNKKSLQEQQLSQSIALHRKKSAQKKRQVTKDAKKKNQWTVNELKTLCKNHSLPQSGNKQALMDRLAQAGVVLADLEKRSLEDGGRNLVSNEISKAAPGVPGHGSNGGTGNGMAGGEGKAVAPATKEDKNKKDDVDTRIVFDENGTALPFPPGEYEHEANKWELQGWRTLPTGELQLRAADPTHSVPNGIWGYLENIFDDNPELVVKFVEKNRELAQVIFNALSEVASFHRGAKYKSPMLRLKRLSDDYKAKNHGPSAQDSISAHSVTVTNATPAVKGGETRADNFPVVDKDEEMRIGFNLFDIDSEPPVSVQEQRTDATRISDLTDPLLEQAEESGPSWEANNEAVQETPTRDPLDEMAQEISGKGSMDPSIVMDPAQLPTTPKKGAAPPLATTEEDKSTVQPVHYCKVCDSKPSPGPNIKLCSREKHQNPRSGYLLENESNMVKTGYAQKQQCHECGRKFVGVGGWRGKQDEDYFCPKMGRGDKMAMYGVHFCRECHGLFKIWEKNGKIEATRPQMHALCGFCYMDLLAGVGKNTPRAKRLCCKKPGDHELQKKRLRFDEVA